MDKYQINTPMRAAIFLAQLAHESGCLRYTKEISSGDQYDTRTDLGNTPEKDDDGAKYKGRGLIQITGLSNYKLLSEALGVDFVNHSEKLEEPHYAALSAGWYWGKRQINIYCDVSDSWTRLFKGKNYNRFQWVTMLVNGGQNGLEDRLKYFEFSKKALNIKTK